jgi:predicted nucleotidyltransferase
MAYTEIKARNRNKYFYRVVSVRQGNKINKKRIYLGVNLNKQVLSNKESEADKSLSDEKIKKNIEKIKPKIIEILKKYKIKRASLFGSYVRGKQKKGSDIDILIQPAENMSILDLSGLKIELEKDLSKKVDLISYKYIHPYLKDRILESEVKIL